MQTWHTAYEVCLRNPRIIARSLDPRFAQENPRMVRIRALRILYIHTSYIHTCIYAQSTQVQNPRQQRCAYTAHARTSASQSRPACLYLACSRRLHQQLASEATFDPPLALHVAVAFRWSRNCAKAADGELKLICILAFPRHNF